MRVLAFDPGYERMGAAVIERLKGVDMLVYSDCLRTDAVLPFQKRLALLGEAVEKLIQEFTPEAVALEKVYFENNAKTAMQIAEVRGMLIHAASSRGVAVHEYTPLQVKVAVTGNGRSDKEAVSYMVARLIALPEKKRLDDEMDAIAIGLTCTASVRYPHTR